MLNLKSGAIIGLMLNGVLGGGLPVYAQASPIDPALFRSLIQNETSKAQLVTTCANTAQSGELWDGAGRYSCQCFIDGLGSDQISDKDLTAFFQNSSNQGSWPPSVSSLFTNCIVAGFRTEQGQAYVINRCVTGLEQSEDLPPAKVQQACQCFYETSFTGQDSLDIMKEVVLGQREKPSPEFMNIVQDCVQRQS